MPIFTRAAKGPIIIKYSVNIVLKKVAQGAGERFDLENIGEICIFGNVIAEKIS